MRKWLPFVLSLAASPAAAGGFEAALVGGYTTAGGLGSQALDIDDVKLGGSFTWGASVSWAFSPRYAVEVSWTRVGSDLVLETAGGDAEMFDVDIDQLHGSFVWHLGGDTAHLRPFLTAGAGAAFFSAPDLDGETKLSFGLGGGLKWYASPRLGLRGQVRYVPTHLNDSSSDFCDPFGFCQGWLSQIELTGGVVVRF